MWDPAGHRREKKMEDKRRKERIRFPYGKEMLPGEGAALLCVFYYGRHRMGETGAERALPVVLVFLFLTLVNMAAVTDWKEQKIPDAFCMGIALLTIPACVILPETALPERISGGLAVSVPMLLLALCLKGSFGGGDIKLMAVCGLFLGRERILLSFIAGVMGAAVYGIFLLGSGCDRKTQVPLGPFLETGMIFGIIFG